LTSLTKLKKENETGAVGTLYFPAGTYMVSETMEIPTTSHYQGLRIRGESQQTSVILSESAKSLFQFGSQLQGQSRSSRFELSHLALVHKTNFAGDDQVAAITVHHGQFAHIHDLAIFSKGTALNLDGLEFSTLKRIHIWPPWGAYVFSSLLPSTRASLDALAVAKPSMIKISSDNFPVLDLTIEDCVVNGGGTAYALEKGRRPLANVSIQGGFLQNLSGDAIVMDASSSRNRNIAIRNVHLEKLSPNSLAISASHVAHLAVENIEIPNQGQYGVRLEDAMRVSIRNSANFGLLEIITPESLALVLENSYFSGITPDDALQRLKERTTHGTTVTGASSHYGIKTVGEVMAKRVIADGIELGKAFGLAKLKATQDQEIPAGGLLRTPLLFSETKFDTGSLVTGDTITSSREGYYRISVSVTLKSVQANSWVKLFLYRNNGEAERLSWDSSVAETPRRTYVASTIVHAKTDDEFSIRLTHSARNSVSTDSSYGTFMDVQYLGK